MSFFILMLANLPRTHFAPLDASRGTQYPLPTLNNYADLVSR